MAINTVKVQSCGGKIKITQHHHQIAAASKPDTAIAQTVDD
jgi:hypothetical protein